MRFRALDEIYDLRQVLFCHFLFFQFFSGTFPTQTHQTFYNNSDDDDKINPTFEHVDLFFELSTARSLDLRQGLFRHFPFFHDFFYNLPSTITPNLCFPQNKKNNNILTT